SPLSTKTLARKSMDTATNDSSDERMSKARKVSHPRPLPLFSLASSHSLFSVVLVSVELMLYVLFVCTRRWAPNNIQVSSTQLLSVFDELDLVCVCGCLEHFVSPKALRSSRLLVQAATPPTQTTVPSTSAQEKPAFLEKLNLTPRQGLPVEESTEGSREQLKVREMVGPRVCMAV
ncbi:MAG TPA: hypothetical protein V6C97_21365, partial [Oculatellaceae cyanobacterium]